MTAAVDLFRGSVVPPPGEWVHQALCAQTDLDMFHPEKGASNRDAKAVCSRCPVQRPCLRWAVDTDQHRGILGGTSPKERHHLTVDLVDAMPPVVVAEEEIPRARLPLPVVPSVRPLPIPQPRPVITDQEPAPKRPRARVAACGTVSGYGRHRRLDETPCDACKQAIRDRDKARRESRITNPRKPKAKPKPAVRVMWLLPPATGVGRTEYAIEDGHGKLVPINSNAAADLAEQGETIHARIVTDWVQILGGTS